MAFKAEVWVEVVTEGVRCRSKRFNNRFICVGVDISIYAVLTEEWSSYSPVLVMYCTHIGWFSVLYCVPLCYPRHGHVLYGTIIIKTCLYTIYTCRAEVPAPNPRPSHDHLV